MCLNPGDILRDRYRIIGNLGQGGFAKTYTASDLEESGNPLCVVKEIKPPQANCPEVLQQAKQQFHKEVEALRLLGKDSRIPEYYDSFQDRENGNFYLVQEYVEGHPLNQEFATGTQWNEEKTVNLLREILEILMWVHQNNVIHRDLKPSNLIRRAFDGKIVLIDFGAVKEISSLEITESGETRTRTIYTPGYTSPEQMHGRPQFCSDIYSAGIIGIQAVTGLRPASDLLTHSQGDIVWHYSAPGLPMVQIGQQLETVLNKMVSYYFPNRYQSAADVLRDLDAIALPAKSHSPPKRKRLSEPILKWLLRAIAGAAAVGAIGRLLPAIFPSASPPMVPGDAVSAGEEILVQTSALWSKQRGIIEFASSNYPEALKMLKQSWRQDRKDPETLIYMNNAFLEAKKAPYYTIAIVVPIRRNQQGDIVNANLAEELLRGIAQAQTEVNLGLTAAFGSDKDFPGQGFIDAKAINGKGLKVIIADDGNIKSEAVKRAKALVKMQDIVGVVGHYTSDMTVETVDIYDRNQLVAISPGSTTEELTRKPRKFFFRAAPTTSSEAASLVKYLLQVGEKKVAGFYNPNSPFTASLWEEFKKQFEVQGGTIVRIREFEDLSKSEFNAKKALAEVQKTGKTAVLVIPDGQVTNATENAIEMIKANGDRNWILGPWTLYDRRTLAAAKQLKSFDKIVLSVPWHPLSNANKKFPQSALKLWGGGVNTRTALTYDATKTLIKAIEMQQEPSREGMQKMLSDANFIAEGATGTIQFEATTGNRKTPPQQLAHIVECPKEEFGVTFVPIAFPTASAAGLKCE